VKIIYREGLRVLSHRVMLFPAMFMTWPLPARTSWVSSGRSWPTCPCWLIRATKAQVTAYMSR